MHNRPWTKEELTRAKEIVSQHTTMAAACDALSAAFQRGVATTNFKGVCKRAGMGDPMTWLLRGTYPLPQIPEQHRTKGISSLVNAVGETEHQWIKTERDSDDPPAYEVNPPGHLIKKISTMLDGQGNPRIQWVQSSQAEKDKWQAMCDAIDRHVEKYKGLIEPLPLSDLSCDDTVTAYPLGDPHLGLLAWAQETNRDFDLRIAEREIIRAIDLLVARAPASKIGLLANLGDYFHAQDDKQLTPTAGHKLDVDTRIGKLADIGFAAARRMVEVMLTKHETVHVFNLRGNHDPVLALMLDRWLGAIFEREARVIVHPADNPFQYFRHGLTLIGLHHGDGAKKPNLPGIMAADRPQDWGETLFRYWLTGHIHTDTKIEAPGCMVESFRTLAARDYWSHWKGYRSGQSLQAITYSPQYGEIMRSKVAIEMVTDSLKGGT